MKEWTKEKIDLVCEVVGGNPEAIIRHLQSRLESLEKDAARYRWLQKTLYSEDFIMDEARVVFDVSGMCPNIEEFYAAIDTAMQANKWG